MPTVYGRKPKFAGRETKWEKRRRKRPAKRMTSRWKGDRAKHPLAEPLTIAPAAERNAALKEGKMVFYDGNEPIAVNLFWKGGSKMPLQGIYKTSEGGYIALRYSKGIATVKMLTLSKLERTARGLEELLLAKGYAMAEADLGHMTLCPSIRGEGLGLKAVSKAERHVRAGKGGKHRFAVLAKFGKLFLKLGYRVVEQKGGTLIVEKEGKARPEDDLNKFHRIEAIDPKTGKARVFTFPVKRKRE